MRISRFSRIWLRIRQSWHPQPVKEPVVDPLLPEMTCIERSAESIRYSILSTEFWISPDGQVREFIRHNTRLVALLFIPALIIIPIIGFALGQIAAWTVALTIIAGHIIIIPVLILAALLTILSIIKLIKSIFQ